MYEEQLYIALEILNIHHIHFFEGQKYAAWTKQPTPEDSRAWSQILISALTGIPGRARQKGSDLSDGSDVKSANAWFSIDRVRFNGVIKAGTHSKLAGSIDYLNQVPYLFFVLWDKNPNNGAERARVWVVNTQHDMLFRQIAQNWYDGLSAGTIISNNFQLHPPVNQNCDIFTNSYGNLSYPLMLCAEWNGNKYVTLHYDPNVLYHGKCR